MKPCCMKFKNGKDCTYFALEGFEACPHHALQYVAQHSGETPEAVFTTLLQLYELRATSDS